MKKKIGKSKPLQKTKTGTLKTRVKYTIGSLIILISNWGLMGSLLSSKSQINAETKNTKDAHFEISNNCGHTDCSRLPDRKRT